MSKKTSKKKNSNKQKNALRLASTAMVASTIVPNLSAVEAQAATSSQQVTFANSLQQNQSKVITIPNLERVTGITTNTGNVNYTVNGDQVTINVSGGTPSGTQYNATKYSKAVTNSLTNSTNVFPATNPYSDGSGYSGTLNKNGSSFVASGSYTPADTKTATDYIENTSNSFPATKSYNSGGYTGTLSKSGSVTTRQVETGGYWQDTGYWTQTASWVSNGGHWETQYDCTDYIDAYGQTASYCEPNQVWVDGGGYWEYDDIWVSTGQQWVATYTTYYKQNYSGSVTKPAVDTRVYQQNYSGTAYKGENENLYGYNVNISYETDTTPPNPATFTPSTTAPTNGNVNLTINYPSDATTKQYKIGSTGTWTTYTTPVAVSSNNTVYARSYDKAGNMSSESSYTVSNIDKTAPTAPTYTVSTTSPTNGNVTVTVTPSSDVVASYYETDYGGETEVVGNKPFSFTVTENTNVNLNTMDSAGNYSNSVSFSINNIDKVAPTNPTLSPSTTSPTNQNVNVSISYPADAVTKQYRINGGAWTTYSSAVPMTANGTVEARAIDQAGNVSVGSYTVSNIDKTGPANATLSASTTAPTNGDVSVTISYPADGVTKQYKIGSTGTWTTYSTPVVLNSNNTVYARSYDSLGNVSNETSLTVNNIDKTAPTTPTISADVTANTNGNVVLTASFPADAVVKEYSLNDGAWTAYTGGITFASNGKLEVRGKDQAGNYSAIATHNVTNIDKTPPANATLSASTTSPTNIDVSVTISYPADASVKQYKIGSTGTWTTYTAPVVLSANNTVYARSYDAVGNVSAETNLVVSNIDKVVPTTPSISADKTTATNGNVVLTATFPSDASVKEYSLNDGAWTAYTSPITMTSNGKLEVRAKDSAGNYSSIATYNVSNIDKTAPANATLSSSTTSPTNTDVSVTISYPSDAVTKQYKIGSGGTWTNYTTPVVLNSNNTVYARSYDAVGNVSAETNLVVSNIDKTAPNTPTISADVTTATNGNVVLTASFPADASVKEYSLNDGAWTSYTGAITMSANGKLEVRAKDSADNYSAIATYNVTNIDKTAPATATLSASTTSPTNQDVSVTITYPSDAVTKQYKIGSGGTWTNYTSAVVLSSNNTVYARSTDAVGNTSAESSLVVNNIDKTAPTTPTISADVTEDTNGNVALTVSYPSDASVKEYSTNGGSTWTAYTGAVTFSANGTLQARAKDSAGNVSAVASYTVSNIDKTAPTNATFSPSTTAPTNGNVNLTINYPSDATVKQYKVGSTGTWTTYTTPVVVSNDDTTIYARSYDAVGNVSAETSYTVTNIDKVAPTTPTISADKTTPTNGNVSLTVTFPSDASVKEYSTNGGSTWTAYTTPVTMSSNGTLQARAKDSAGNVSAIGSYSVSNIDKTAPSNATLVASTTAPTNGNVSVTISYPSDANVKEYKISSTGTWTAYTTPVVLSSNNTVYARSTDAVGNVSAESSLTVNNIDKVNPGNPTITFVSTNADTKEDTISVSFASDTYAYDQTFRGSTNKLFGNSTKTFVIKDGESISFKAYDEAGNVSEVASYTNVDTNAPTAPTITADKTTATNGDVVLTATFPSDATVKEYSLNGGSTWLAYTAPITMTANGTLQVRAKDEAGNVSAIGSYAVTNIDKTAPVNATFLADKTVPTNTDVKVTINYPADASVKQYKVGSSGTWTTYTTSVVVSSNDTVYARSYDAVGNVSAETNYVVSNIDKVAPTTPTITADVTSATNGNVVLTASFPADVTVKEYSLNDGTWTSYTGAITMSANGKLEVRGRDQAGNYSGIATYNVTNIDKNAPATATLTSSTTSPTNQDVSVTISYPVDAVTKQYKIGSTGTWTTYSSPVVLSANNTVYARSMDAVGNVSAESSLAVTNIDKTAPTAPTVSADVTTATNGNVTLTATFPADASVEEYRIGAGAWTAYTNPVIMSSNGTFEVRAKDSAGNYSSVTSYTVSNIDKTAPVSATFVADKTTDTNTDVKVTINYPADASVKQYKVGSTGTWTSYTTPVVVSVNNTVYARSYDAVGNVSAETSYVVSNIDKVVPNAPTVTADVTEDTNGDVFVTVSYPSDATVKEYSVNGGSTWVAYTSPVKFTANGTLQARAKDSAGNYSSVTSYTVNNIDKTAPVSATFVADKTTATNTDVKVTINYPADASVKQYKVGSTGSWTTYSTPVVVSSNNTVYARSYDAVGNVSAETSYAVTNIDKTSPNAPTLVADKTTPTNGNVVVTATFPSDAVVKEYRQNNGSWVSYTSPVTFTANGTMEVRAKDEAGNYSTITSYEVDNIDKTAPVNATLTPSTTAPTNQNVSVTIAYPSDANVKEYKIGSTGTWTAYTTPVVVTANNTVYARSTDAVGNVSSESSLVVSNIDKTAPTTPTFVADKTADTNTDVVVTVTYPSDASVKEYSVNNGQTWVAYTSPIVMKDNGTVQARAKDVAGNVSTIGSYTVDNIDKTAPVNPTFVASITAPTNQDVNVTINYPADASVKQYKVGSTGTWTTYATPVVVSANNTVYARAYDAVGNVSQEVTFAVTNIDKVAPTTPTISANVTADTNGDVILTATFPVDSAVKEYRLNNGSWMAYSSPVTMTANGKMEVRAKDNAGNYSAVGSYTVDNIDKTPPANATLTPSTTAPTNQNVSVTISYPADASVKQYKIGSGGTWTTYTTPVVVSANNTVYARSIDSVGNMSNETSLTVSNIDKTAPNAPTISADKTSPTNGNVVLTATFPGDAVVKEFSTNGGSTWTAYTTTVTMTANGTFQARAKDSAGNVSSVASYEVTNIDKTAPVNATLTANTTSPTNNDVTVTISYPSDASVKQYKIGSGGTWTSYTAPITLSSNNTVYARSYDAVGNVSAETSLVVGNIDKVAPTTPSISADKTAMTNGNVVLTATFPADADVKEYRLNNGTWMAYASPVTMTANGTMDVRATDDAGNVSSVGSYTVSNIDKTAPVVATLSADKTTPTNTDVKVTISYPSDASIKEYKIGTTGTWTAYTTPVTVSSNNTVYARSTDAVGNTSAESSLVVSNIDKTAPIVPTFVADKTAMTNTDVKVTVTYPTDAVVKEVRVNGGSWTAYTTPIVMTANGKVEARAKDDAGNYSVVGSYDVTNIDKTAPVNPTFVASTTAPTNQDVSVTVNFPADATIKQYKIGSTGTWMNYTAPVVLSANNTIYARGYDAVGNMSQEATFDVTNIDKVSPNAPTLVADKTAPTNTDVVVTATFPSDASVKQVKVNDGAWVNYVSPITLSANGKVESRSIDNAGNVSSVTVLNVTNIDKTAPNTPTLVADKTNPTNTNVVVTATFPADTVVKEVRVNGGSWTAYTTPITLSANGKVEVRGTDNAGNVSAIASYDVTNIDKVAPNTPTLTPSETKPTNTFVSVSATFPADAVVKEVRVNNGSWSAYTNPVVMSSNGKVEVRATDSAGNVSSVASYEVTNIDKTAPNTPTFSPSKATPTNTDVQVTIAYPSDAVVKEYRVNGGEWTDYTSPVNFAQNGKLEARATDNAGNVSSVALYDVTNIDKVAPNKPVLSADKTTATNTDVKVTATFSGDSVKKEVRVNNGAWVDYTTAITMTANGKVEARSYDNAGNVSAVETITVDNIDKVKPNASTFTPSTTAPTNKDVTVSVTFPSDVVKKEVRVNGGEWTLYTTPIVMKDNGSIEARGWDNANNVSDVSRYNVTNIDLSVPTVPTYTIEESQNTITLNEQEGDNAYYRLNDGEWVEYTTSIVTEDGSYKVDIKVVDDAGNESEIATTNVDMYRDALNEAEEAVQLAESNPTQENVDNANEKINDLPENAPERETLTERSEDVQDVVDAIKAIEQARESKNPEDVQNAQDKIDLLDGSNPVIIDIIDEIQGDFAEADILALVATERYSELSTKYGMSRVSYDALVNIYYAEKYTGDTMFKFARDKVALVSTDDKHYALVQGEFTKLQESYSDYVEERVQTDAEIKAESSVKVMEANYDPTYAVNTQALIDKVEDPTVRASFQKRLDDAKAKYEASKLALVDQQAVTAVEKAESTKNSYYVSEAYKKVNALANETLKAELTSRLQALEAQIALDRQISDATRTVELAEQYKYQQYIDSAQIKINALPNGDAKTSLQARLDAVKAGLPTGDQATIITKAKNALSLAQSLKTQYYVDKAQTAINLVEDATIKAELQAKLDAIVVKP